MGVTELVFKLNYFKGKISAILKRHCCHSNHSHANFFQNLTLQTMPYGEYTFIVLQ